MNDIKESIEKLLREVDAENNLIAIKGAIPGPKKGIVMVVNSVKKS